MRVGIFGGTFDPPHLGHVILAAEAVEQAKINRLLWVLTPEPPHKLALAHTPVHVRRRMVETLVKMSTSFEFSDIEFKRPGPHYAVDTIRALRPMYPSAEMVYIFGEDSLCDLPKWHTPEAFVHECDAILVYKRGGFCANIQALSQQFPELPGKLTMLPSPLIDISSHEIRERVKNTRPFWQFVTREVYSIIIQEGLYRTTESK